VLVAAIWQAESQGSHQSCLRAASRYACVMRLPTHRVSGLFPPGLLVMPAWVAEMLSL
jgi:hypothetical protein